MNTKTLTLRALILAPVLLIAAPAAASTPTDRCDTYIKAAEQPIGWRIACVGDDIGSDTYGVTYLDYRIILIRRGLGEEQTRLMIAHENAHAEAENLFSPATKAWFTQRLGKTLWYDTNDYYGSPVEVWASSRARCQGAPSKNIHYQEVPCDLVEETLRHADTYPVDAEGTRAWRCDPTTGIDQLNQWTEGAWQPVPDERIACKRNR